MPLQKSKLNFNTSVQYSKSFLVSLTLHGLIGSIFLIVFSVTRNLPSPEPKIAVSLMEYTPSLISKPYIAPVPKIAEPVPHTAKTQPPKSISAPLTPVITPIPVVKTTVITPPTPAVPTPTAPVKAVQPEPIVTKTAPPPPPVNVQKVYEEENLGEIRAILAKNLIYPKNALRLKQQGSVLVTFTLTPEGEISRVAITEGSGYDLLDSAALKLIETTVSQFPKPSKNVTVSVPIGYKLR